LYIRAVQRVDSVRDRMPQIILRGHWCDSVLNVHASTDDKIDVVKDSFYVE
jgi:hypothetical protein